MNHRLRIMAVIVASVVFFVAWGIWETFFHKVPLYEAGLRHDWAEVTRLLQAGADLNETTENYNLRTPLFWPVVNGRIDETKLFIAHGADLNKADNKDQTALDWAFSLRSNRAPQAEVIIKLISDAGGRSNSRSN